jgi:ubiquinone biosynthesis protein
MTQVSDQRGPRRFRALLERLGPTYVKVGQFLALRPDLVPQEYCDELIGLFDRVPPFPWDDARLVIADDLGDDPARLFAWIDPVALGAGAYAQTHAARLHDGTEVVVKVQRPGIRERVLRDVGRLRVIGRLLELAGVSPAVSPSDIAAELRAWLLQELDMSRELENMARLHRLAAGSPEIVVPRPFRSLSGDRVVTSERLAGTPLSALLVGDRDQLAENLLRATLMQIFRFRFFHADVHPGNVFALPRDAIGYVDFGLCEELDETLRIRQAQYLAALYERDVDAMYAALAELLDAGDDADLGGFRTDFVRETRTLLARADAPADARRSPIGDWLVAVLRAARANGLRVPPRLLSLYRTLLTAETVARRLSSTADLRSVGRDFFSSLRVSEIIGELTEEELRGIGLSLITLLDTGAEQVRDLLIGVDEGTFAVATRVSPGARMHRARRLRVRMVATALLGVGIASLLASAPTTHLLGIVGTAILGTLLVVVAVLVAADARRAR